jgi:hypothetical protein
MTRNPPLLKLIACLVIAAGLWIPGLIGSGPVASAQAQIVIVPEGNRNVAQPEIPYGSVSRTRSSNGSFQEKYEKIRDLIASDRKLRAKIIKSAARFEIDPIHIVGALVGEHTYNVDALDYLQTYLVKAASYLKSGIKFAYDGESVGDFVNRPQFSVCASFSDSYRLWACRERVWQVEFAGKNVDGKDWPNDRFGRIFFQPLFAGQTFGLGQLNPLTALQVDDLVRAKVRRDKLDTSDAPKVYEAIMDPDSTLDYMAAVIRISIDSYRDIAGLDISGNPGITATLYNLGDVITRAETIREKRFTDPSVLPEENYYGWLVNDKIGELRAIFQ